MKKNKKIALITGATSGIGKATALLLAANGFNVIITGRRAERLETLSAQIKAQSNANVLSLNFDIREQQAVENAINSLPENWKTIDVLVNNAGLAAGLDPVHQAKLSHWERMIDTNLKGLLYISRLVAKDMVERRSGHIVNISSISGKEVYPNGSVYCATKHAVDALTKGMRMDFLPYGIKVTAINPGLVETEFSIVRLEDEQAAHQVYKGLTPLNGNDVAQTVLFAVTRPPHVNINDLIVMPTAQASATMTHRTG